MNNHASVETGTVRAAQFQNFLQRLDPDRNRAGEKYEELRRKLIKFFEWNCCFPAEDLVDETFDRVAEKLAEQEVHNVPAFAWGVAKNVRQEAAKRCARLIQISDLPPGAQSAQENASPEYIVHEKITQERQSRCFTQCLQRLLPEDRELFLVYHNMKEGETLDREHLAEDFGLTIAALRVRINRIRHRMEKCVARYMGHKSEPH